MDASNYSDYSLTTKKTPRNEDFLEEPSLKRIRTDNNVNFSALPKEILIKIFNQYLKSNSLLSLFFVSRRLQNLIKSLPQFSFIEQEKRTLKKLKAIQPEEKQITNRIKMLIAKFKIKFCSYNEDTLQHLEKIEMAFPTDLQENAIYFGAKRLFLLGKPFPLSLEGNIQVKGKISFSLNHSQSSEFPFSLDDRLKFNERMINNFGLLKFSIKKNPKLAFSIIKENHSNTFLKTHLNNLDLSLLKILFEQNWQEALELVEGIKTSANIPLSISMAKKLETKFFVLLFSAIDAAFHDDEFASISKEKANQYLDKIVKSSLLEELFFSNFEQQIGDQTSLTFFKKVMRFFVLLEENKALEIGRQLAVHDNCRVKALISFTIFSFHGRFKELENIFDNWKRIHDLKNSDFEKNILDMCNNIFYFLVKQHNPSEEDLKTFAKIINNYYDIDLTGEDNEGREALGLFAFLSCLIFIVEHQNILLWLQTAPLSENARRDAFIILGKDFYFHKKEDLLESVKSLIPLNISYEKGFVNEYFPLLFLMGSLDIESALDFILGPSFEGTVGDGFDQLSTGDELTMLALLVQLLGDLSFEIDFPKRYAIADVLLEFLQNERLIKYLNLMYNPLRERLHPLQTCFKVPIFEVLLKNGLFKHGEILLSRIENYLFSLSKKVISVDMKQDEKQLILQSLPKTEGKKAELKLAHGKNAEILPAEFNLFFEQLKWIKAFRKQKPE